MTTTSTLWLLGGLALVSGPTWAQTTPFAPVVTYPAGGAPRNLAVADVNSDGKTDVLTANQNTSTISVLLGNGNGTFQAPVTYSTGASSNPYDIAIADVNGDNKPDLLTANYGSNAAGVLLGNGNGTFQAATAFATGAANGRPVGIAVADVTGDGKPDLLTANSSGYSVSLFVGTGNGTFQSPINYSFGPTSASLDVVVADVNADGQPDVLAANAGSNTVGVLLNTGITGFQSRIFSVGPSASFVPYGLAVADVNADGRPDVVTANQGNSTVSVLVNIGNSFAPAVWIQNSGSPVNVAVADINADSQADLLTANPGDEAVRVLLGKGGTTFQPLDRNSASIGSEPYGIVVADVNADGQPDVITSNYYSNSIGVLLNASAVLSSRTALPGATATLHPNPAADYATLTLGGLPTSVAQVHAILLDATGRTVYQGTLAASQGCAHVNVPAVGLAPGLYLMQLAPLDGLGSPVGSLPTQRLSVR